MYVIAYVYSITATVCMVKYSFPYTIGSHKDILLLLLSFPIVQLLGKCYIFPCVGLKQNPLKSRVLENRKMSTGYEDFKEIAPTIPM